MGNSSERVPIKDLGDVVYYHQTKEYTDQEYESSRDLKKEIQRGRLTVIDKKEALRGSVDGESPVTRNDSVSLHDIKQAMREMIPDFQTGNDMRAAVRDLAPLIIDVVRQEMSKMSVSAGNSIVPVSKPASFEGPTYIPDVKTDGMISNIDIKKTNVSAGGAEDALAALRRMKK